MPIINILTWPTDADVKQRLMKEITRVVNKESGAPLDKISIIFQEIQKDSWCEAGVIADDLEFSTKSRRTQY